MNVTASSRSETINQDVWEGLVDSAQSGPRMMRDLLMLALSHVSFCSADLGEEAATAALIEILHYPAYSASIDLGLSPPQKPSPAAVRLAQDAAVVSARRLNDAAQPAGSPSLLDKHLELERLRIALADLDDERLCTIGIDDRQRLDIEMAGIQARHQAVADEIAKLEGLSA